LVHPLIQHAVAEEEYLTPTPIQEQAIPHLIEGRDLLGCAQTGTGKTAAFLLPIFHRLLAKPKPTERNRPRALILAPTRELAAQIAESCTSYGRYVGLPFAVVFGGVSQYPQVTALNRGAVLVVATPGRLLDLMEQGHLTLDAIEEFVLDEADRMLDMGFLPDIRRILAKLPKERHSQFFSATLSPEVLRLAKDLVKEPVQVTISPDQPTVDKINQRIMFVDKPNKDALLIHLLNTRPEYGKVIVFARTRHGSDKIERKLEQAGIRAEAIHSDKTQRARTDAMNAFRNGRVRVLVATDIASRGIDVDGITHVVNFDMPVETESYVHRIGRTARAGADGYAISFVSGEERGLLRAVERMIKKSIEIDRVEGFHSEKAERSAGSKGAPDSLPRPPWAGRKAGPGGRNDRRGPARERPGSQGRRQPDFRRDAPAAEGDARLPSTEPAKAAKPWFKPFQKSVDKPQGQRSDDGRAAEPPRLDEARGDRPKRPEHKPGERPRSSAPRFGQGRPQESGGFKGPKKPSSSRPPWMT
jgi:ATP-dependent RNA helicase RhlE